ncbi:MAG TPA: hypothetical protein DDY20_08165 [Desulfobulbaceae bacterium]|nr:hypothetical protein [Desulfobulbaceae bacterium]
MATGILNAPESETRSDSILPEDSDKKEVSAASPLMILMAAFLIGMQRISVSERDGLSYCCATTPMTDGKT